MTGKAREGLMKDEVVSDGMEIDDAKTAGRKRRAQNLKPHHNLMKSQLCR
jgi:hypothetical protein